MNPDQLNALALSLLKQYGFPIVAEDLVPAILVLKATNPALTTAELVSDEDGVLKHSLRKKISFGVDFIWPFLSPYVDEIIGLAVPIAEAQFSAAPTV